MRESTLKKLNSYLTKQTTFCHKIQGHPLERCQEHIKKIYMTLLQWVLEEQPKIDEKQLSFLNRLKANVGESGDLVSYLEDESIHTNNRIEAIGELFVKYFKKSSLKYHFMLDTLLLLMKASEVQLHFVHLLCEVLELDSEEVSFLIDFATCIVDEDDINYMRLIERVPQTIHIVNFSGYVKPFLNGRLVDEEAHLVYYAQPTLEGRENISFNKIFKSEEMSLPRWVFKQEVVVFENWQIDLSRNKWIFRNNQKVVFKNCQIIGHDEPINFDGTTEIYIENCSFREFSNRVFLINDCMQLNVKDCIFKECLYMYDLYQNSNGAIYFIADKGMTLGNEERRVVIENTHFIDCCVWNQEGHYYSDYSLGYSMNIPQKLINCTFKNCLSYMGSPKRLCNGGSLLFNHAEGIECTLVASNPIL